MDIIIHVHGPVTVNLPREENMATQAEVNELRRDLLTIRAVESAQGAAFKAETATRLGRLGEKIAELQAANPNVDLTPLRSAVNGLSAIN